MGLCGRGQRQVADGAKQGDQVRLDGSDGQGVAENTEQGIIGDIEESGEDLRIARILTS